MELFGGFRDDGWNTYYDSRHVPAFFDLHMVVLCFLATVVLSVLVIIVIGTRSKKRFSTFIRMILNLHPGIVILVCLTGKQWIDSHIHTHCDYATRSRSEVEAEVSIHVGLTSINITLSGTMNLTDHRQTTVLFNEIYNLGKVSTLSESLDTSLRLGKPYAILYVLDYLRQDEGELRWSREMRQAGHFVYIMLWSALASWGVSLLVLAFVVVRGALFMGLSGLLMAGASLLYHCLRPGMRLTIPFDDAFMYLHYGWCFWLCGAVGIVTMLWSAMILILHMVNPGRTANAFNLDSHKDSPFHSLARGSPLVLPTPRQQRKRTSGLYFENHAFEDENHVKNRRHGDVIINEDRNIRENDKFPDAVDFQHAETRHDEDDTGIGTSGIFSQDVDISSDIASNSHTNSELQFDTDSFDTLTSEEAVVQIEDIDDKASEC